jgi:hypothetical protein
MTVKKWRGGEAVWTGLPVRTTEFLNARAIVLAAWLRIHFYRLLFPRQIDIN